MILAALGLALAGQEFDPSTYYKTYSDKELRRAIEACGFEDVWVGRNKAKRAIVRVKDTEATDKELICAATIIDTTFKTGEFSPELAPRYSTFKAEIARPRQVATARIWFAKNPEMGPPPEREEGESDAEIAERVESFCGPKAKGFFAEQGERMVASPDWASRYSGNLDAIMEMADTMGCVIQASFIAELEFDMPQSQKDLMPL